MSGIVRFGGYTFPATLTTMVDNFSDGVPTSTRLPGLSGGWPMDAAGATPTQVGSVTVGFTLVADDREDMDALRDAARAMAEFGLAQLVYQPTEPTDGERWCWARVQYITMSQRKDMHTDLWQDVTAHFFVPDPVWRGGDYGALRIGEPGLVIADPAEWVIGSGGYVINATASGDDDELPYAGNATAAAVVTIKPPAGFSAENVRVERRLGALVVDRVQYTGVLTDADEIIFDGERGRVFLNGVSVGENVNYLHPDLFRLEPGQTDVVVLFDNAGGRADVTFHYWDTWR